MAAEGKLELLALLKDKASGPLRKLKGLAGGIGGALKKGALVGGAAIVGLGVLAFKFGNDFKEAFNIIAVGTGATGEDLAALKEDFKATFANVPADMKDVATATADLNTRLGLTGKPLQDMSAQFLELSRITKTDVGKNIQTVTRLFGDWAIATEDQSGSLDRLFKTSQATGIGVDRLSELVVQFGAPLRGFGFDLDQSTALLAKFEKEGVNTEAVMAGLKIGLGKLAAAGKDPVIEFAKVSDAIQNAGTIGEANAAAIELFGSRAGPDMAAAIREGRFEIDDFIAQMDKGGAGIMETAEATKTWKEKLLLLRNKALVQLEPLLTKFVDLVGEAADWLGVKVPLAMNLFIGAFQGGGVTSDGLAGKIERLGIGVREFIDAAIPVVKQFASLFVTGLQTIGPLVEKVFNFIIDNKAVLIGVITAIGIAILLALGPGAVAVAAIIGLIVLIGLVRENFDAWRATVEEFVDAVIAKVNNIPVLGEIFRATVAVIGDKIAALRGFIQGLIDFVTELVTFVKAIFSGDWAAAWDSLKKLAVISLNLFLDFLQLTFLGTIKSILGSLKPWDLIKAGFTSLAGKILGAARGMISKLERAGRVIGVAIMSGLRSVLRGGLDIGKGFANAIIRTMNNAIRGINNAIPDKINLPAPIPDIDLPNNPIPLIPTLERGGRVVETGLAVVHKDEEFSGPGGFRGALIVNGPLLEHHGPLMGNAAEAEQFATLMDSSLRRKWRRQSA